MIIKRKSKTLIEKETLLPFWLFGATLASVFIHNGINAVFGIEEAVFFFVSLILILAFWVAVVYAVVLYLNRGKPKDIWKLGWLGALGVLSIFAPPMIVFYGFFAFFGVKKD